LTLKQQISALRLIPSTGGVFEVSVGENKIYSKIATGKFPDPKAILKQVQAML
jgi:selenoprotein W-related protein